LGTLFEVQKEVRVSEHLLKEFQAKYLDPLKTRMRPITMTETAATRSPKNLTLRDNREAERPVKKRVGTVPNPKKAMVRNPVKRFWVVAALMIIAQESMQGKKPVRNPRAIFDSRCWDRKRGGSQRAKKDPGVTERAVWEKGRGRIFKSTRPSRIIKIPPMKVRLPRSPEKN
jgi:hypothetical protein